MLTEFLFISANSVISCIFSNAASVHLTTLEVGVGKMQFLCEIFYNCKSGFPKKSASENFLGHSKILGHRKPLFFDCLQNEMRRGDLAR